MVKKSLGYTELEWICPQCSTRNTGLAKLCSTCGSAQPDDVEFVQPLQEVLVEDDETVAKARAGADIHCGFCGTRNPADATTCRQCGGDLAEGQARAAGAILGAHRADEAPPVICATCGAENPGTARSCANCGAGLVAAPVPEESQPVPRQVPSSRLRWPAIILAALAVICVGFFILTNRTQETIAEVAEREWTRSIVVEGLVPAIGEAWQDELPAGVEGFNCQARLHHTQDQPTQNAIEVCGTAYTVDTGTGLGEVVQDCRYEVYEMWCDFEFMEWAVVDTLEMQGTDLSPSWPGLMLEENQREGEREESYVIIFHSDDETYRYRTSNYENYQRFTPGSRWVLDINTFGGVMGAEPAR